MENKKLERGSMDRKSIVMAGWRKSEVGGAFTGKQEEMGDKRPLLDPETNIVMRNKDKNKVAVTLKTVKNMGEADTLFPFLGELHKQTLLKEFIEELCKHWALENPNQYALQYDRPEPSAQYVTEENRHRVKDGVVLNLVFSAPVMVKRIMVRLEGSLGEKISALEDLIRLAPDPALSGEIDSSELTALLDKCMERDGNDPTTLSRTLTAYLKGAIYGILSWDQFEPAFIEKVASFVSQQDSADTSVLIASLGLLKHIMLHNRACYEVVEKQITFPKLQFYFQRPKLQASVLGLINSSIKMADAQRQQKYWMDTLFSQKGRRFILDNVFKGREVGKLEEDLAHELYILQQFLLRQHEEQINNQADDSHTEEGIKKLKQIVVHMSNEISSVTPRHRSIDPEMLKLGFTDEDDPAQDLTETPLGKLALTNMVYFADHYTHRYIRLIRDNSLRTGAHTCPFAIASISLTELLCDILEIGHTPSENGTSFYPMLLSHDHPIEAVFSVCIMTLYRTWKDMKATWTVAFKTKRNETKQDDFSQVLQVVKEQVSHVLAKSPRTMEFFSTQLTKVTYREIKKIWRQKWKKNQTSELKSQPVKELRKQLEPEILDLIQEHRLRFLCVGTGFRNLKGMGAKNKVRLVRLSPNHKFLLYDDFEEQAKLDKLLNEDLKEKIVVKGIEAVVMGIECPHVKEKIIKKSASHLAFSLLMAQGDHLNFVCQDEITCNYWVDGINALLGRPMTSLAATEDLEMLANMEVRLRLLDAEGITIPSQRPPIPPPPPNFDFCFGKSSDTVRCTQASQSRPVSLM